MGIQTDMTNRAWRALETFGADPRITDGAFRAYKFDLAYSVRSDMAQDHRRRPGARPAGDGDISRRPGAAARLGPAHRRRTAAAPPWRSSRPCRSPTRWRPASAPDVRAPPSWRRWRGSRRSSAASIRSGARSTASSGASSTCPSTAGPDTFRAVYGQPMADGRLKAVAGDTFIMFVTWDRAGTLSAQSIHQFGSATTDEASPHYADQTPLFVAMKTKPVLFTEDELAGHVKEDYAPGGRRNSSSVERVN